jgi:hypothetical protein
MSDMPSDAEKSLYLPSLRIQICMTLSSNTFRSTTNADHTQKGEQDLQIRAHYLLKSVPQPKAMSTCLTLAYQVMNTFNCSFFLSKF